MHYRLTCDVCGTIYPGDISTCIKCQTPSAYNSPAHIDPRHYTYDIETLRNIFSLRATHVATDTQYCYEISDRKNQVADLVYFLRWLQSNGCYLIGYNNIHFDYPVIHRLMDDPLMTYYDLYRLAMDIIGSNDNTYTVWDRDQYIKQIDLQKIHNLVATSLKDLEIMMGMEDVRNLEFDENSWLSDAEKDDLLSYNAHDVLATTYFYVRSIPLLDLRAQLSEAYGRNFLNHSDPKIGEAVLVDALEKDGVKCYEYVEGRRQPVQSSRYMIDIDDIILPYVTFETPELKQVEKEFRSTKLIVGSKIKDIHATIDGFTHHFKGGGLHSSLKETIITSDDEHQIIDVDVKSFYPNLSVVNTIYPEHLGEAFCRTEADIFDKRSKTDKSNPLNYTYKISLNGAYGKSSDVYSPLYDPQYTMTITINGQLLLAMLFEQLVKTPGLSMIQCNTDGITFSTPRRFMDHVRNVCKWWEQLTGLELEEALYSKMIIRDVNNYMAVYEDGKIKRIGAYSYLTQNENPTTREVVWKGDPSALIIPKAAEQYLLHGTDIDSYIRNHDNKFDFMLRHKVRKADTLMWGREIIQRVGRYYVSTDGRELYKISKPKQVLGMWKRKAKITDEYHASIQAELKLMDHGDKELDILGLPHDERINTKKPSKYEMVRTSLCAKRLTTLCSKADDFDWETVDYDYYIMKARELTFHGDVN